MTRTKGLFGYHCPRESWCHTILWKISKKLSQYSMHKKLSCRFLRLSLEIKLGYAEPIVISDHVIISSSACEIIRVESLINVNIVAIKKF